MAEKEIIGWYTANGKHIPIFADNEPTDAEKKKDREIAQAKEEADRLNGKTKKFNPKSLGWEYDGYSKPNKTSSMYKKIGEDDIAVYYKKGAWQYKLNHKTVGEDVTDTSGVTRFLPKQFGSREDAIKAIESDYESKKQTDIAKAKEQDNKSIKSSDINPTVLSKFPKKIQGNISFLEKDSWGKYHIVVNSDKFGEASFHDTSFSNIKWEISEFLKDGSRY